MLDVIRWKMIHRDNQQLNDLVIIINNNMMNRYVHQLDYELLNDKVELNFFHHKHLEMHQVQEVSNVILFRRRNL